ncbi:MAG: hypothetical protein HY608_08960 [Planctomycetes bacterium]|nr:hypothetical protein [Planctomycetota bacterium]
MGGRRRGVRVCEVRRGYGEETAEAKLRSFLGLSFTERFDRIVELGDFLRFSRGGRIDADRWRGYRTVRVLGTRKG